MTDETAQNVPLISAKWDRLSSKAHLLQFEASETWFLETALGFRFLSMDDKTTENVPTISAK